jgi:lipopolysaccharide/colanic/teichoic acid biosynthesis glycosyltransferase
MAISFTRRRRMKARPETTKTMLRKRFFDVIISLPALFFLSPLFLFIAFFIKIDSRGGVFFRQTRIGRNFIPFQIYKFRTMQPDSENGGLLITVGGDPRRTNFGRILRKTKFDELPQLFNVLKGEMSLVGPRPEVEKYVNQFRDDYWDILKVRPGITDDSSIIFRGEEELLKNQPEPEEYYVKHLLPRKIHMGKAYVNNISFDNDLRLIMKTLSRIVLPS